MRIREGSLLERQQWFILCLRFVLQFNCTDCLLVRRRRRQWGSIISQGVRPRTSSSVSQSELEMDGSQNGSLRRPKSKSYRFSIRQLAQEWGFLCHSLVNSVPGCHPPASTAAGPWWVMIRCWLATVSPPDAQPARSVIFITVKFFVLVDTFLFVSWSWKKKQSSAKNREARQQRNNTTQLSDKRNGFDYGVLKQILLRCEKIRRMGFTVGFCGWLENTANSDVDFLKYMHLSLAGSSSHYYIDH